jgi:DNA-binding NarL/FixJ family response regulator
VLAQPPERAGQVRPAVRVDLDAVSAVRGIDGAQRLTIDVELQLVSRPVTDAHRRPVAVALEVTEHLLGEVGRPVHPVHDLQRAPAPALQIRERFPAVGILLLSTHTEIDDAVELFSATASSVGYLLKDSVSDLDELTGALTRISEGGTVFDPKLVVELLGRARRADPLDVLTPREREVVGLMAEGQSNTGIAQTLWITPGAVEKHINHIFSKLGIPATLDTHRRVLAVIIFLEAR